MDAQHRQIFEYLGLLRKCALSRDSAARTLEALETMDRYAVWHLEREERLLRVRRFPGFAAHLAEHDAYRRQVAELKQQLASGRRDVLFRVINFLSKWWLTHILMSDRQYGRYFSNGAAAGEAAPQ